MGVVVLGKELPRQNARASSMESKRAGKSGWYLSVLNCITGVPIAVVADMRPAVALGDRIGEQKRHGLGAHRGAPVGMQGELPASDAFLVAGGGDELVGELGRLLWRDHPADHVAAEHIEEEVEYVLRFTRRLSSTVKEARHPVQPPLGEGRLSLTPRSLKSPTSPPDRPTRAAARPPAHANG